MLLESMAGQYARSLPRKQRDAFLVGVATDLRPEPSPMECREKAQARREAAEWWLHKMPMFLRE